MWIYRHEKEFFAVVYRLPNLNQRIASQMVIAMIIFNFDFKLREILRSRLGQQFKKHQRVELDTRTETIVQLLRLVN